MNKYRKSRKILKEKMSKIANFLLWQFGPNRVTKTLSNQTRLPEPEGISIEASVGDADKQDGKEE